MQYTLHPKFVRLLQLFGYALLVAILLVLGVGVELNNYRIGLLEKQATVPAQTVVKVMPTIAPTATPSATLVPLRTNSIHVPLTPAVRKVK